MRAASGSGAGTAGFCWVDVLLAMALAATMAAMAVPLTARTIDATRARDAAAFIAGRIRLARQDAAATGHAVAIVFDEGPRGWSLRVCRDGSGNGVRRADIASGRDRCIAGPWALADLFPRLTVALDASLPGIDNDDGGGDAVRFGRGAMASCSNDGGCTPGTIFLRGASGDQYAVRVGGTTGRTRTLRFDPATAAWGPG
jgi:type II secretory pathway pseudopilin PulG